MQLQPKIEQVIKCSHCGEACEEDTLVVDDKNFCCIGCKTVYEILAENELCAYYDLDANAGISLKSKNFEGKFDYLLKTSIESALLDFKSEKLSKVTFYLPTVHCTSCVWLLENFHKILKGVLYARLQFVKKELSLSYDPTQVNLKEIVSLLATLGYEPLISLESATHEHDKKSNPNRRLLLQIAVTGFAMGNIMLLSFPEYFKLDLENKVDAGYQSFFLYLNFALSLPVFFFGAADYLTGAGRSLKDLFQRKTHILSVDIPIAMGISALFVRSTFETLVQHSAGYWDSLAGLVFFLLVGKWVQMKTYDFLSFERNYQSFFPLAVKVKQNDTTDYKNVAEVAKGDTLLIHNEELIPADSILMSTHANIDYSFVSGESEPISLKKGDLIYAGGRLKGQAIATQVVKEVSQSYLTQLWNQENFEKEKKVAKTAISENFSKYFTYITLGVAGLAGMYWWFTDAALVWPAVTAVLMVACPCALTLSLPFTMGTVMGILGKNRFYLKNQDVIQLVSETDTLIFDKTGTLTKAKDSAVAYHGQLLSEHESRVLYTMVSSSVHPVSKAIATQFKSLKSIEGLNIIETKGAGLTCTDAHCIYQLGNAEFIEIGNTHQNPNAKAYFSINNEPKGYFSISSGFRNGWKEVIAELKNKMEIFLLSGDNDRDAHSIKGNIALPNMLFNQKPSDKLAFVKHKQEQGHRIIMVGDGINDAGALRQSDIGIAITEDAQSFTPASDAIIDASVFKQLPLFLQFGNRALTIVKVSFLLSLVYNFFGIGWAVTGQLSPVLAAIFMPLSSISVVLFAVSMTYLYAWKKGLLKKV